MPYVQGHRGGGGVVTHLHTHFHICLAMKKQKTAKFTRTQDVPSRQWQGGQGTGREEGEAQCMPEQIAQLKIKLIKI